MLGFNGGLIGATRFTKTGIGVWTPNEQVVAQRDNSWVFDPIASAYIQAVEAADGQALESGVKVAINTFVLGCKADGIWSAIKASCILAGARTLNGALVPLVGPTPTNPGSVFLSDDYNRKTGLLGNGSTKYLDTNIANNAAGSQNDIHGSVYATTSTGAVNNAFFGASNTIFFLSRRSSSTDFTVAINQSSSNNTILSSSTATGFIGAIRNNSSSFSIRSGGLQETITRGSTSPDATTIKVFARTVSGSPSNFSSGRFAFYSFGESLDLALLDSRVTTLINDIAAAIP